MISREFLYDISFAYISIRKEVESECNRNILLEIKARLETQENDKFISNMLITICDEMISVLDAKKYEQFWTPTAHYRFDASKVPDEILKGWN